ncbi:MAG: nuclear transport factor 2 family protein [Bacteroidetes bacterium]|nr:nuclear transport factor 2 family protein [Bacteroidota bacterium]
MTGCTLSSSNNEPVKATIIALEEEALREWNNGNPDGFIALSSDDVVYFDPTLENQLVGKKALEDYYNPIRGKDKTTLYKMINPVVQLSSEIAVLSFHYEAYMDSLMIKLNCTEVYKLNSSNQWKIIHTHWSFVQP